MKVRILKDTVGDKKPLKIGQIIDLSEKDSRFLIGIKKAEPCVDIGDEIIPDDELPEQQNNDQEVNIQEKSPVQKKNKNKKSKE